MCCLASALSQMKSMLDEAGAMVDQGRIATACSSTPAYDRFA